MHWCGNVVKTVIRHVRNTVLAGVLIMIPVAVTYIIFKYLFDLFDPLLEPAFNQFTDSYVNGMGLVALFIIIYLVGLITTHVMGRRLIAIGHGAVDTIPVVRAVYRTTRQAIEVLSTVSHAAEGHSSVVLVEFPGHGLRSIGLVTSKIEDQDGQTLLVVYVPTSPFPTSGFLVFLPPEKVTMTDLPVDDAIKLIVSAGILAPERIVAYPGTPDTSVVAVTPADIDAWKARSHYADGIPSNQ